MFRLKLIHYGNVGHMARGPGVLHLDGDFTFIEEYPSPHCGTQPNNCVHREDGHERIDRMPVAQCGMRDVVRNREQQEAHGER
jgi:hypothetical protein